MSAFEKVLLVKKFKVGDSIFDSCSQGILSTQKIGHSNKMCSNWDFWEKAHDLCVDYVVFMPVTLLPNMTHNMLR